MSDENNNPFATLGQPAVLAPVVPAEPQAEESQSLDDLIQAVTPTPTPAEPPAANPEPSPLSKLAEEREQLLGTSPEQNALINQALVNRAIGGDVKAMTLLINHKLGRPGERIDLNITAPITPEEAAKRVKAAFGLKE